MGSFPVDCPLSPCPEVAAAAVQEPVGAVEEAARAAAGTIAGARGATLSLSQSRKWDNVRSLFSGDKVDDDAVLSVVAGVLPFWDDGIGGGGGGGGGGEEAVADTWWGVKGRSVIPSAAAISVAFDKTRVVIAVVLE